MVSGSEGQSARAGIFFLPRPSPDRPGLWLSPAVPICPMAAGQMLARVPSVRFFSCWGPCEARLGGRDSTLGRWGSQLQVAGLWCLSCCCPCAVLEGREASLVRLEAHERLQGPLACLPLPPSWVASVAWGRLDLFLLQTAYSSSAPKLAWPLGSAAVLWGSGQGAVLAAVAMGTSQEVCFAWE